MTEPDDKANKKRDKPRPQNETPPASVAKPAAPKELVLPAGPPPRAAPKGAVRTTPRRRMPPVVPAADRAAALSAQAPAAPTRAPAATAPAAPTTRYPLPPHALAMPEVLRAPLFPEAAWDWNPAAHPEPPPRPPRGKFRPKGAQSSTKLPPFRGRR
jgi:hypothetical protein